jgi:hypothetical protein
MSALRLFFLKIGAVLGLLTPTAEAQDDSGDDATRRAANALLSKLDQRFNAADAEGYLQLLHSHQPLLLDRHSRRIRTQISHRTQRRSALVSRLVEIGDFHAGTVVSELTQPTVPGANALRQQFVWVFRHNTAGALEAVEVSEYPAHEPVVEPSAEPLLRAYHCKACNYGIGPADGWLCVPIGRSHTHGIEGATFILLGSDVALDLNVQFDSAGSDAATVCRRLARQLADHAANGQPGMVEPWPALDAAYPAGMPGSVSTARVVVDVGSERLVLHCVVQGKLRHLLLLRGERESLRRHATAISALLASYRLIRTEADAGQLAAAALLHHTGATLDRNGHFECDRHDVELDGPAGWTGQLDCKGNAFQCVWRAVEGQGELRLTGIQAPSSLAAWTEKSADAWLRHFLGSLQALGDVVTERDSGWQDLSSNDSHEREIELSIELGGVLTHRILRVQQHQGLLVVCDAQLGSNTPRDPVLTAVASLRSL